MTRSPLVLSFNIRLRMMGAIVTHGRHFRDRRARRCNVCLPGGLRWTMLSFNPQSRQSETSTL